MMNEYIELGKINKLMIDRFTEPGVYLVCEYGEDVLLPNQYVTKDMKVRDLIDVFIYTDSEDRLVATTQTPYAMVDEFASLKVVDVVKFGSFLDWGLLKDLLIPKKQQKSPFVVGEKRVVRILEDKETQMLYATEKFNEYLTYDTSDIARYEEVELLVTFETPLGYKVIVNEKYNGMIFKSDVFKSIEVGDKITGYVKTKREDGKLDISLQPIGRKQSGDINSDKVLEALKQNNGKMNFTSKSNADDISDTFGISKKAFKRALVLLQENKKIELKEDGIYEL